jgi:beta-glucosidase
MKNTIKLLLIVNGIFVLCGCCVNNKAENPCDVALGAHQAVAPEPKTGERFNWWMPRHQAVLETNAQGNVNMIFIGDSITHQWETVGKEVWKQYFEPLEAVNMGFGGDQTQNVLWRLQNGELDGINPKVAVLMIGTNNSNGDIYTSEQIAEGIKAIVCQLRTRLSQTKVLMLSIFPRGSKQQREIKTQGASYNPQWAKNEKASKLASKAADNKMVYYLDLTDAFLDEQGVISREIMPDLLHLSEDGYIIWAEAMMPKIKELMHK